MKVVDFEKLESFEELYDGSYTQITRCIYENTKYALKTFTRPDVFFNSFTQRKFEHISNLQLNYSVIPKYFVRKENEYFGYLMDLGIPYQKLEMSYLEKYHALMDIKKSIIQLTENGIIHGDIHAGNILLIHGNAYLCDFDDCDYLNGLFFETNPIRLTLEARNFLKRNFNTKSLDIHLFNILTFKELNRCEFQFNRRFPTSKVEIECEIQRKRYGVFKNRFSKKLLKAMLEYKTTDFLIDTIDESDVKRYFLSKK